MKILGIRVSPQAIRYAIVRWDGNSASFINHDAENKLDFPATLSNISQKTKWLLGELDRIYRQHPDLKRIIVKENEYTGGDTARRRESTYLIGIVFLFAAQQEIFIKTVLYSQMKTKSKEVKEFAETRIGKSQLYWDTSMADAVVAAWTGKGG